MKYIIKNTGGGVWYKSSNQSEIDNFLSQDLSFINELIVVENDNENIQSFDYDGLKYTPSLQNAKQSKLAELNTHIESAISNGLEIDGFTYPIHDTAITNMNVLLNTFNTEVNLGTYNGTDLKYLIDNDYNTQQVTKDNYRSAILQCINFREQLHFLKASKTSEINACNTVSEVEAVQW